MKIQFFIKYNDSQNAEIKGKISEQHLTTYEDILQCVIDESTNFFAPFIEFMESEGHETDLIITNLEEIQRSWAKQNNCEFGNNWTQEIAVKQIEKFKADILYVSSNFEFYGDFLKEVKPNVKKICAWISCRFDKNTLIMDHIDHVFTLFKPHYEYFNSQDIPCTLVHAVFDDRVLDELTYNKKIDISFVGGVGGFHKKREALLKKLIKSTPILLWGYGFKSKNPIKNLLKQLKNRWVFIKRFQGEAWGKDMLKIINESKITVNAHGDNATGHAVNMRLFEATGVGTLLITEKFPGIEDFFEPGKDLVCYENHQDALDKIRYYLTHNEEREKIAKSGQQKTLNNYTFKKIAPYYLKTFENLLKGENQLYEKYPIRK
ncbi:glycosyltransferase [Paracrocinitomix mangrovi]|uniref:CgeB family protein n=1 Tax=Paracrocinitomix mangrovi TaxID=2862509 RepID=UPI001C8D5876|nr:glycosyltransferase [Paracrocinitomix mangrovi]UKN01238.1 glycosyltransferase [Paracrocinitomix mangrovi]